MELLHLFPNQPKFFSGAFDFYNLPKVSNTWFVPEQILSNLQNDFPKATISSRSQIKSMTQNRLIICHSLLDGNEELLSQLISDGQNVLLHIWGGDTDHLYNPTRTFDKFGLFHENRLSRFQSKSYRLTSILSNLRWLAKCNSRTRTRRIIQKTRTVTTMLGSAEIQSLRLGQTNTLNFIPFQDDIQPKPTKENKFDHYLIGNCALPSCRHVESLQAIEKAGAEHAIIPLSYPNNQYQQEVMKWAQTNLSINFRILHRFMPKQEYFDIINSAGTHIHYSIKQQALYNIFAAIFLHKKLIINPKSPTAKYLHSRGIRTFTLDELNLIPSKSLLATNATLLEQVFQNERRTSKAQRIMTLETLCKDELR